ncbi:MAG: hypothetical protein NC938_06250 [Candidatus Omnitrophica bacterium]|nr:hypothetical protein [Candidatus Omnitrophota bacterium]
MGIGMDGSVLIAKFLGPFIVIIGTGLFLNVDIFRRIGADFFKNPALVFISGIMTFLIGLAIVIFNNIWAADWRLIITIFGWLTLIKGALLVVLPDRLAGISKIFLKNIRVMLVPWAVIFILGIFLTYKGYFTGV